MAKSTNGAPKAKRSSLPASVVGAAGDVVAAAQQASAPVTRKTARELKKLGKQLDAARAKETKRLRQLAKAESTQGSKQVAKRRQQAAEAAADVAGSWCGSGAERAQRRGLARARSATRP